MAFVKLQAFEKQLAADKRAEAKAAAETAARKSLQRAVREVLPKGVKDKLKPKRPRGRAPVGGVTRKEVKVLRAMANQYLAGAAGLTSLETEVKRTAIVILLIDGVLGTEPWRASAGPHGGIIAANARLRYLENAIRILDDMRQSQGTRATPLLEGVIDAERTDGATTPA